MILHFNLLTIISKLILIDSTNQTAIIYISTIITFILLVGVIIYHVALLARKNKSPKEDEYPLIPSQSQADETEVTHSVIEISRPHDQSPPPEVKLNINQSLY